MSSSRSQGTKRQRAATPPAEVLPEAKKPAPSATSHRAVRHHDSGPKFSDRPIQRSATREGGTGGFASPDAAGQRTLPASPLICWFGSARSGATSGVGSARRE